MLVEVHMGPIHFVFSAKSGCTIKKKEEERRVGDGIKILIAMISYF